MNPTSPEARAKQVDGLFALWSQEGMPGAVVGVFQAGEVLYQQGYGLADLKTGEDIRPDRTAFLLASVTKPFTALAVLILAERGCLCYDSPLSLFFPQFQGTARTITIRHLLQHTAGLPEYDALFVREGIIDEDWPRSVKLPPSKCEPTSEQTLQLLARQKALLFRPGQRFKYSNSGYVVLACIVEKVSGKRFREFLAEAIFAPLGMRHSLVYDETRPPVPGRATSYSWRDERFQEIDYTPLNFIYGPDGVYTTLEDMARWEQALLYTDKLVKQSTLQEAFTPGRLSDGASITYGYGWNVAREDVWHNGWWLGFRTYIIRNLASNLTVVVLSNCAEFNADRVGDAVARLYLEG
jgi:CubicO group peptidase (beta-lactamase class C family)